MKQGKAQVASDPSAAAATLSDALSLWRADALADVTEEPSLRGEAARLEELRLSATEHRVAAEIAMGGHSTVVPELESLTARYPLRERMWANLMLALYRSGRQAEALSTFERARQVLVEELGADPSPELQRLHEQILHGDPALGAPARGAPEPATAEGPPEPRRPAARHRGRRLPDRAHARSRRHERRVPRRARLAPAEGRAQDPRAAARRGRTLPRAVRPRVPARGVPRPPERDPDLRGRRSRAATCSSRCATWRGPTSARCCTKAGRSSPARAVAIVAAGRRRPRRRARAGARAPRRQARQRPPRAAAGFGGGGARLPL